MAMTARLRNQSSSRFAQRQAALMARLLPHARHRAAFCSPCPTACLPAGEDALWLRAATLNCGSPRWKFSSFQFLTDVFQRCLKSWHLCTRLHNKETNLQKTETQKLTQEKIWQTVMNPSPPLSTHNHARLLLHYLLETQQNLGVSLRRTQMTVCSACVLRDVLYTVF